jgi:hypothetical protein
VFPDTPGRISIPPGGAASGVIQARGNAPQISVSGTSPTLGVDLHYQFEIVKQVSPFNQSPVPLPTKFLASLGGSVTAAEAPFGDGGFGLTELASGADVNAKVTISSGGEEVAGNELSAIFTYARIPGNRVVDEVRSSSNMDVNFGDTSTFEGSFANRLPLDLITDTVYDVNMDISLSGTPLVTATASVDPIFDVPVGYTLYLSPGIENGSVPEPSTWAMVLMGFAGLGFAGYRASRKSVTPAA